MLDGTACTCGKRHYTKAGAKHVLRQMGARASGMHAYRCPSSSVWHLGHPCSPAAARTSHGVHYCPCGHRTWTAQALAAHTCPLKENSA